MVDNDYIPDRGHVIWLNFDPQSGHEQKGRRPALVLSPRKYNVKTSLALICPITSKIKKYPFEVKLPDYFDIKGVIISDQIKSLDWRVRQAEYISIADSNIVDNVLSNIKLLLE